MNKQPYTFLLEVGKQEVFLTLKNEDVAVEKILVGDGYGMAEQLLPALDSLLAKHHLTVNDVEKLEVVSDLPEGYSARRIAETIASVYAFGKHEEK